MAASTSASRRSLSRRFDKRFWRRTIRGYLFISPVVLGLLLWTFGPMLASAYFSLTDYKIVSPPVFVGLQNYADLFLHDRLFFQSLLVTLRYTVMFVILVQLVSLPLALLLTQKVRGIALFRTLFYLPLVVPVVATALLWRYIFNKEYGPVDAVLRFFGLPAVNWLGSPDLALVSMVIISIWGGALFTIIYVAAIQHIPEHLHEAARIDGANNWQRLRFVTIPMLTPAIFFCIVTSVILSFQFFIPAFVMTGGGPANSTYVYNLNLYDKAFKWLEMGYASAMAWVLFAVIFVVTLLIFRTSRFWVHNEAEARE